MAEKGAKRSSEEGSFEMCEVCRVNHAHGRRHRYFPSHLRALHALLSRFRAKLSDLRFFLRHPSRLRPEHAHLNRLWCPFCALDLRELGSAFACSNAIRHLASEEHLRSVRDFLRKHGGGMDQVDSFRVSEAELLKWEKGCEALKSAAHTLSEGPIGPSLRPSKSKAMRSLVGLRLLDKFPTLLLSQLARRNTAVSSMNMLRKVGLEITEVTNLLVLEIIMVKHHLAGLPEEEWIKAVILGMTLVRL